ncbi:MAG: NADP-dependent malic enzyme [Candidatus Saccharibacteria bacterium]|nr:NADP-dependent malic enzyme [Candidatus Saccharibacteria bacterium]
MDYKKLALRKHKDLRGKIYLSLKDPLDSQEKLSTYYTPGVAAVSSFVAEHPEQAREYTWLNNNVAVISDGSAVLGLGDIGPKGALPVMEGKAMLFKHFADIDAVPIILDVHSEDEIVAAVKAIAPSFGGINLEDIAAPQCFVIEDRLKKELSMPVFHDDQHGTAIVVLAGLLNALRIVDKDLNDCRVTFSGVGAAGVAIMKLLKLYAPRVIIQAVDSKGTINKKRTDLNASKQKLVDENVIVTQNDGNLANAMENADIFIGVSQGNLVKPEMIKTMARDPIIFAMANPEPEILPDVAHKAGAAVVATGRSDFPNQVNNALAFPGIFRGALDNNVRNITDRHKIAAAKAIASLVADPSPGTIIPSVLDDRLVPEIAKVII